MKAKQMKTHGELFVQGKRGEMYDGVRKLKGPGKKKWGGFGSCPRCGDHGIDGGPWDCDGEAWQTITCAACGFEWKEVYSFAYAEAEEVQAEEVTP